MTIQHDLSLNPDARMQRRVSDLEQGYVANQQSGAWVHMNVQCGEFNNGGETPAQINCMQFEIPAYGQYVVTANADTELRTGGGYAYTQLQVNGAILVNDFNATSPGRIPNSHTWGGFLEKGMLVQLKGACASCVGGGFIAVYNSVLVVHKVA